MKTVIKRWRIPIKLWLDDIEDGTLEQATNLVNGYYRNTFDKCTSILYNTYVYVISIIKWIIVK